MWARGPAISPSPLWAPALAVGRRATALATPEQARYGRGAPTESSYSGVLECPCNSNFGGDPIFYPEAKTKLVEHVFSALPSGACQVGQKVGRSCDSRCPHRRFHSSTVASA